MLDTHPDLGSLPPISDNQPIIDRVYTWILRNTSDIHDRFNAERIAPDLGLTTQQVHSVLSQLNKKGEVTRKGDGYYTREKHDPIPKATKQAPRGSIIGPVREWLKTARGPFKPAQVAEATGMAPNKVHSALNNLKQTGEIVRAGKGQWVAAREEPQTWEQPEEATLQSGDIFEVVGHAGGRILVRNAETHEVYELRELS